MEEEIDIFNDLENLVNVDLEIIWIELFIQESKPLMIGSMYRPPNADVAYLNNLKLAIGNASTGGHETFVMMGDFNLNVLSKCDNNRIKNICTQFKLIWVLNQ